MTFQKKSMLALALISIVLIGVSVYAQIPTVEVPIDGMKVINLGSSINRVVVGTSDTVRAEVVTSRQIMLFGLNAGSTTLHVWTQQGLRQYKIRVADISGRKVDEQSKNLLRELGEVDKQGNELRVFTPEYRDISEYENYIEQLLQDDGQIILSDQVSGKIFVLAPPQLLDKISNLLSEIDVPSDKSVYSRRIELVNRPAKEVKPKVEKMLSEEGSVLVDEETNSLLVIDTTSKVKQIENYLNQIDVPTVKQVKITARFVEMTDEATRNLGVNWAFRGSSDGDRIDGGFGQNPRVGTVSNNEDADGNPIPGLQVGDVQGIDQFQVGFNDLSGAGIDARIHALETEGLAKTISSPTVLTRNQQQAKLTILNEQSYVSGFESTTGGEGGIATTPEIDTVEDGIILKVTPLIGRNDVVQLDVTPTLKIADIGQPIDSNFGQFFTPTVDERTAELAVALRDGQTLVIGGLDSSENSQDDNKVPFLGDIPVLGYLFKEENTSRSDRDITIFLTAEIVPLFPKNKKSTGDTPVKNTKPETESIEIDSNTSDVLLD